MKNEKIYVVSPFLPPLEDYIKQLEKIWKNKYLTNQGPLHKELEDKLSSSLEVQYNSLFTNGHLALEAAIKVLKLPKNGEVITPAFTFVSTTHAIINCGLKPVFCDIKQSDYTIDESKIEELITKNTVAILPVHVYGYPCNTQEINKIAKKYNLKVIYDAAHAFKVKINDQSILNYGDISMVSFHATKLFHTIEGGMLVYSNLELKNQADKIKNFGIENGEDVIYEGFNGKMSEFQAAMGLVNLEYIDEIINKRKYIVEQYIKHLKEIKGIYLVPFQPGVEYNYAYFPILIEEEIFGKNREQLLNAFNDQNIYPRKYFSPLISETKCYKNKIRQGDLSVSKSIADRILCLPLYPDLTDANVDEIVRVLKNER